METFKVDFYYDKTTLEFICVDIVENVKGWEKVKEPERVIEQNDQNITAGYSI